MYQELKWKVQAEYDNHSEMNALYGTEDEFCSDAINKYNDSHRCKVSFAINNEIIEIIEV